MMINSIFSQKVSINSNLKFKSPNNNFVNATNKYEQSPQSDSINFKGRPPVDIPKIINNSNIFSGLTFATNLIKKLQSRAVFNSEVVAEIVNKQFPSVSVKPIQELEKLIPNASDYRAYSSSDIDSTFNRINLEMYVMSSKNANEIPELISDASHEYTHVSQELNENEDIILLKQASRSNRRVAETLRAVYESTFRVFDIKAMEYVPVVKEIEGNETIDNHLRLIVRQLLQQLAQEEDPTHMHDFLSAYSEPESLITDVKRYCQQKATKEKEAYATEYALAQLLDRNDEGYKRALEYFSNLADAFGGK